MEYIDKNLLEENCSGDIAVQKDLLRMGLTRLRESMQITDEFMTNRTWETLADCIHRMRPVINFCGIVCYEDKLFSIEKAIKENRIDSISEHDLTDIQNFIKGAIDAVEKELS